MSVAQVARRYALNSNLIHKWLRDPQYGSDAGALDGQASPEPCFLPVEIVAPSEAKDPSPLGTNGGAHSMIEIDLSGGHHLRIVGSYDPEALARLIRGLSA